MRNLAIRRATLALLTAALALPAAAPAAGAERQVTVEPGAKEVKRYARIEFVLRADVACDNPYDPGDVDFALELAGPGGRKLAVPAFYFQPYERDRRPHGGRKAEWLYPVGPARWLVRFAPTEVGKYTAAAVLKDRAGTARSAEVTFECTASADKGFVRVSPRDPRYLEFDDGSPFFAVGQNVAFVTDSYVSAEMIRKLGANGANFVRVWACSEDWAMAIEARKSAWGRSWDWRPPIVMEPDRESYHSGQLCLKISGEAGAAVTANPCRAVALKPSTRYRLSGMMKADEGVGIAFDLGGPHTVAGKPHWTAMKEEFTTGADQWWLSGPALRLTAKGSAWIKNLSVQEAAGGPELLWEADVNRPVLGVYNQPDCFMVDRIVEAAEAAGIYLQVVLLTRDHYMRLLAKDGSRDYSSAIAYGKRLVRYAAARWGYATHVAAWEYFNEMDPGKPAARFYAELGEALEQTDVNRHLRATSDWHSPSRTYQHPKLDTADMHYYMRPADGGNFKDAVAAVLARWQAMDGAVRCAKPAMFSEFGLADDKWQQSPDVGKDRQYLHLHDGLWASALSGFASTVCPWWWDDIDKKDMYHHYRGISKFTADIPFTRAKLRPAAAKADAGLRAVGLQGDGGAYLWVSDPRAAWWHVAMEGAAPAEVKGATVTVEGLPAGPCRVQWWDTREGNVLKESAARVPGGGALRLDVPPFTRDMACKILRGG
jgi:hypothetical protein